MDWQTLGVIPLVAGAGLYLGWRAWRTWSGAKGGCGGSCGCARGSAPSGQPTERSPLIPVEQVRLRRREPGPG